MLICCWSTAGGAGTTVVSSCLALLLAARTAGGAVLADLAGDVPAVLGIPDVAPVPDPDRPGLAEWLAAGDDVPADALARIEVPARTRLGFLPRGDGRLQAARADALATLLDHDPRPVVADCGRRPAGARAVVAEAAPTSLLVTRLCYVALRRAQQMTLRPTGVVVVREPGRAITTHDVERVAKAPVVAHVEHDPGVARAVDAGLLTARRLPRSLESSLRTVVKGGRRAA